MRQPDRVELSHMEGWGLAEGRPNGLGKKESWAGFAL